MHCIPGAASPPLHNSSSSSSSRHAVPSCQQHRLSLRTQRHTAAQNLTLHPNHLASRPSSQAAVSTAVPASSSRHAEQHPSEEGGGPPPRQRRTTTRRTPGSSGGDYGGRGSNTSSTGGGGYTQQASWQRPRRPPPSQQQQRRRRQQGSSGADGDDYYYDDGAAVDELDQEFLDPQQAAKLRKMMKAKGRDAVLDKQGFVKPPLLADEDDEDDAAAAAAGAGTGAGRGRNRSSSSSSINRQRRAAPAVDASSSGAGGAVGSEAPAAAAALPQQQQQQPPAAAAASSNSSSTREAGRPRLFDASQLQAAAPGSAGAVPVLPIVRPGSAPTKSRSTPERPVAAAAPQTAAGSRAGSASASGFYSSSSWKELGASQAVQDALTAIGVSRPSHVQAAAYKALSPKSGFKHVAVADQAGSGKTLAYLLPLLQQLKEREQQLGGPATKPNSPSLIILTPTTELAQQVGRVVKALSQAGLRVRSSIMTGGQQEEDRRGKTFRTQTELLAGGVDVLVATPGRLRSHFDRGSVNLSNTAALVLDEVDVLAGGEVDYAEHIAPLRASSPSSMRCVLVSATLPQHTFDELQDLFMGLGAAFGPRLHRTAQGVVEELIDCSGGDEISLETGTARKLEALYTALDRVRSPRTVVFCNKIETCRVVENALRRQLPSHQVLVYHEAIREDLRTDALNTWLSAPRAGEAPMVLVCTDRTSRGIDSMWCEHVVLFEFPRDPSEYVRRVGRTARGAGGKGVVSVLVLGKQVPLAKDILERNREGVPVHRVPRLWSDK